MATNDSLNILGQSSSEQHSFTIPKLPSPTSGWEDQVQVFADVLQSLEHNFILLAQAFSHAQPLLTECEESLQSSRLRYLAWLCGFDFASGKGIDLGDTSRQFVMESLAALSNSCASLVAICEKLIAT